MALSLDHVTTTQHTTTEAVESAGLALSVEDVRQTADSARSNGRDWLADQLVSLADSLERMGAR
jgi:hypothetical protein